MSRRIDCDYEKRLLCAIAFMRYVSSIPVLITVRMATMAKRGPNLRRRKE